MKLENTEEALDILKRIKVIENAFEVTGNHTPLWKYNVTLKAVSGNEFQYVEISRTQLTDLLTDELHKLRKRLQEL